ncbi:MAG: MFS transporter [Leptospiraceae bacterium]|nr:MFS transporter [Leptospiraceae bacterium]MCP5499637.1 MFS transporter [Leptospiraceae bacterium]
MKPKLKIKEWQLLALLACIQFTHILDFVIIMPLGPQLMKFFSINPRQFGLIVSSYTFSAGFAGLVSALFIDKFDRKASLNTSYLGFIIGTLSCGFAPSYETLLLARTLAGAFGGVLGATIFSIVGDLIPYERRGKATGTIMSAFSVASVAGVPIGLYLATLFTWRMPFYSLAAISTIIILFSHFLHPPVREHLTRKPKNPHNPFKALLAIFRNPNHLWSFSLIMTLMFAGFSVIPFIAPYLVSNVGLSEKQLAYVYLFGGGATFFTARIIGSLADKFGKQPVFMTIAGLSMVPIIIVTNLPKLEILYVLLATTLFFILVSGRFIPAMAMITSSVHPENRGGFMSVNSSIQQVSAGLASLISGMILVESSNKELLNYPKVGIMACCATVICIFISRKLKVAS